MARSTIKGFWRSKGSKDATPAVSLQCIQFTLDPTAASADTGKTLPAGAVPLWVQNINGGATGGTNPTVDVGTSGDTDGFANELDADGITALTGGGALLGTALTADTAIYAGAGSAAATGGSCLIGVYYIMQDDGTA